MPGPHGSTAAIRYAVRAALAEVSPGAVVLVACSGGGDSMALAEAVAHEQRQASWRAGAVIVDHGLQPGSGEIAAKVSGWLAALELSPIEVVRAAVAVAGEGLEAAARTARYAAFESVADRTGAQVVLLGHTLDDQAEQVLLGLARGAGARSLAGMAARRGRYRRPLLGVTRAQCRESLVAEGISWWEDPMNEDLDFRRVRARRLVGELETELGPGVAAALARTSEQLREDADYLDGLADAAVIYLGEGPWPVPSLAGLPRAVRTRLWRRLLISAGAPSGQVSTRHTEACDALLTDWRGQGPVSAPGQLSVSRTAGWVTIARNS